MGWMHDLSQTYDSISALPLAQSKTLTAVAHSTHKAQLELILDLDGNLMAGNLIEVDDQMTPIPVTENSATRASDISPHALSDKLEYVAGDYGHYVAKYNCEKHVKYCQQLADWADSPYSNPRIQAVRTYVERGSMMADLIALGLLHEADGKLVDEKILGVEASQCGVRFDVRPLDLEGEFLPPMYHDRDIFNLYTQYYLEKHQEKELCYVTGDEVFCTVRHPARVRHAADKSKLISSSNTNVFTFKGRVSEPSQVANVGYEVSQKAHSALRWLLANQGFRMEELYIAAWEMTQKPIISPFDATEDALFQGEDLFDFGQEMDTAPVTTNQTYAKRVSQAARGYRTNLTTQANIVVMAVEAATTGRLSVVFYEKFNGSQFMDNVERWHSTCYWRYYHQKWDDERKKSQSRWVVGAPSPRTIAETVFGNRDKKVIKNTVQRLLPCIVDGAKFPRDLMHVAVGRAANRYHFDSAIQYQSHVAITCAIIRKVYHDYNQEEWDMKLDKTITDRSYLFGRLLGAAQKLEELALYYGGDSPRTTAAERLAQQFPKTPMKTWKLIDSALNPYKLKLKSMGKGWSCGELQEIYDLFDPEDFISREPLSPLYLLGYNCQLNSYRRENAAERADDTTNMKEETNND